MAHRHMKRHYKSTSYKHTLGFFNRPIFLESLQVRWIPKRKLLGKRVLLPTVSPSPINSIQALKEWVSDELIEQLISHYMSVIQYNTIQ